MATSHTRRNALVIWAGWSAIILSVLHLLFFGVLGAGEVAAMLSGALWEVEGSQELLLAFWTTVGSFPATGLALGVVLLSLGRRGVYLPSTSGWILGAWALLVLIVMPTSGFPLFAVPAILLICQRDVMSALCRRVRERLASLCSKYAMLGCCEHFSFSGS